ncbi:MAG: HDOD domain-containing protein, partial [Planctomycetota bacterium]
LEASAEVYGHNEKGLWVHALCVASGAHTLAKLTRQSAEIQEEIFVAGLLHDVGKVPLANYMVEAIQGHEGPRLDPETERHVLGIDHQEAGGIVSRKWNLSPMVHEVIERHETGSRGEHRLAVAIVRLSDLYSRELGKGYDASSSRSVSYPEEDLELLGLDEPLWSEAREEMREAMDAALATLGNL